MSKEEIARYHARAEEERRRAQALAHPHQRQLALDLADRYEAVAEAYRRVANRRACEAATHASVFANDIIA